MIPAMSDGAKEGWFELGGESARLRLTSGGWLVGTVQTQCDDACLLRAQSSIIAPVKALPGGRLRSEVPCEAGDVASRFIIIASALEESMGFVSRGGFTEAADVDVDESSSFASFVEGSGYGFEERDGAYVVEIDDDPSRPLAADVELVSGFVVARTELSRTRALGPDSRGALEHFLLFLNARLRFARGTIRGGAVVLEVVFPISSATSEFFDKALGALGVGFDWAHRESRALADSHLAQLYLGFHQTTKEE